MEKLPDGDCGSVGLVESSAAPFFGVGQMRALLDVLDIAITVGLGMFLVTDAYVCLKGRHP